jgi:L,D-peptidoglycan transpeptidase YkuD (ErfK/YbiS/YcfS/YnhG family)
MPACVRVTTIKSVKLLRKGDKPMKHNPTRSFIAVWASLLLSAVGNAQASNQQPLRSSEQMIVVTTPDWSTVEGRLQRYERNAPGAEWERVGDAIGIVVGKKGMGWGAGLMSTDRPSLRSPQDPVKKEGDGKSPAGVFRIGTAFGYAAQKPADWKMPYVPLTPSVECVDDSTSHFYNQIVDRAAVTPDWHSSEHMSEAGVAYRWGAVIDHNVEPATPSAGSCVFMHIWGGSRVGTAGCTAMPQEQLEPILAWLDPAKSPILVQAPVAQYTKLRRALHLPELPWS